MDIPKNNIAGRLYHILTEIKSNYRKDPYIVFARIFELDPNDRSSILQCYAKLYGLAEDTKNLIMKIEKENYQYYTNPIDNAIIALSKIEFNIGNGLYKFNDSLGRENIIRLQFCSILLSGKFDEEIIEKEQLNKLYDEVNDLIKEIKEFNIDPDLKALFIGNLKNINIGITRYEIYGKNEIKSILESCVGSIILNGKVETTENEKACAAKIFGFISKLNALFTLSKNVSNQLAPFTAYIAATLDK